MQAAPAWVSDHVAEMTAIQAMRDAAEALQTGMFWLDHAAEHHQERGPSGLLRMCRGCSRMLATLEARP